MVGFPNGGLATSGGPGTVPLGSVAGPRLVIAPANASLSSRRAAHVVLTGVADQIAINAEIAAMPVPGTVELLEGNINLTDDISIQRSFMNLQAQYRSTYIQKTAGSLRGGINVGQLSSQVLTGVRLSGITLDGNYSDGVGTAVGVQFSAAGSEIIDCDVKLYRGDCYHLNAWDNATTIFELYLVNCFARAMGGHGYNIGPTVLNSEFERVFTVGGNIRGGQSGYGGHGFFVEGAGLSFHFCHPYFCFQDGFHASGLAGDLKINGGEFETCDGIGLNSLSVGIVQVINASFYANNTALNGATQQLVLQGAAPFQLIGNRVFTVGALSTKIVEIVNATTGVITGNHINLAGATAAVRGIAIENSSNIDATNNAVINGVSAAVVGLGLSVATKCTVSGNSLTGGVVESGASDFNHIHDNNVLAPAATPPIVTVGANTKVRQNIGFVTEASNSATVLATTTTLVVNHGLAVAPTFVTLTVGPGGPSNASTYWVSNITATQFTINVNIALTLNVLFFWTAIVGNL